MEKNITILFIFIITIGVIFSSGCANTTQANSTWGEKKIAPGSIKVSDAVANRSIDNESVYYVRGNLKNQNSFDALDVKIKVITYDKNGTVFAVNETPYIDPKNIPAEGKSYFYARFNDPEKKIDRFEIQILGALGVYF